MNIEDLRVEKRMLGLTVEEIASLSGVPKSTVSKIFSGETKNPGVERISAIEKAISKKIEETGFIKYSAPESIAREPEPVYGTSAGKRTCTEADYWALPDDRRAELIDGVFYDMAPPTVVHQEIIGELYWQIKSFIKEKGGKCKPLLSPVGVRLDKDDKTMVEPDLLIICEPEKQQDSRCVNGAPDFVAEVVSASSGKMDYIRKMYKYAEAGVREYWIIDPLKKRLTVFSDSDDCPRIQELSGKMGLEIYGGNLEIDLDAIRTLIPEKM